MDLEEHSRRLAAIAASDTVMCMRQTTMQALGQLGIKAAFALAPLTRDPRVGRILTSTGLPWPWEQQYRLRLHLIDPLPDLAVQRLEPVVWPDDLVGLKLDRKHRRFMEMAAQHGIGRGIGVACFGPDGRSGFLGCVLDADAPVPGQEMRQQVQAIGQTAFLTYCRIVKRVQEAPPLSNRELEVLHWIGRGKSNSVIADILGISASSVDVYVRRIFAKLGVTDRTTASIRAFALGLLVSGDYERFIEESKARQDVEGGRPTGADDDGQSGAA